MIVGGPAFNCRQLLVGDKILKVDGVAVDGLVDTHRLVDAHLTYPLTLSHVLSEECETFQYERLVPYID